MQQKMKDQELKRYSADQFLALKKGSHSVHEFYLFDSKGAYDSNSQFYELDDKTYFFSRLLKRGGEVKLTKDFRDFMKQTEVPRYLTKSTDLFDDQNASLMLGDLMKRHKLNFESDSMQLSEDEFKWMSGNKNLYYPILTLYLGEKIRSKLGGSWEFEIDSMYFIHVPVIKAVEETYYPGRVASDIFKHHLLDMRLPLNTHVASVKGIN